MRILLRPRFWRALRYRAGVAAVGFVYLFAALEIPLPAAIHKESAQPFPCQNHLCGCQSAEQCWRHCCCFTPEQRWAWARAHDVEPPAYAEKPTSEPANVDKSAAVEGWNTVKLRDRAKEERAAPVKNCCSQHAHRSSCCSTVVDHTANTSPPKSDDIRWATTLSAGRCQGYATVWINVGAVLPIYARSDWVPDWLPPSLVPFTIVSAANVSFAPDAPPPRCFLVSTL